MISPIGNSPSFKSSVFVDVGGSTREGSCKIDISSNDAKDRFHFMKTRVNDYGKQRFENEDDFLRKICKRIKIAKESANAFISSNNLSENEKTINSLDILVPSYMDGDKALYFPNLRNKDDKPLRRVDFSKLPKMLREFGVDVKDGLKVNAYQDATGSGLAVAEKLYNMDMLKPGKYYTVAITGGGCGVANIRALSEDKILLDSTGSSYLTEGQSVLKVSKAGACAPSVIRNYCKAFGIDEEFTEDIASCSTAEFTMNDHFEVPKTPQGQKLENLLLDTGKYEIEGKTIDGKNILTPISQCKEKFVKARYNAINKYAHALARLCVIRQNEGSNGLILTGTLAGAIDKVCKKDYNISLSEWIMSKLEESYKTYELGKVSDDVYKFKVYCGKEFQVDNNTAGKRLLTVAKRIGQDRFNWIDVDLGAYKKNFADIISSSKTKLKI